MTKRPRPLPTYNDESFPRRMWKVRVEGWHPTRVNELLHLHPINAGRRKKADAQIILVACTNGKIPKAIVRRRVSLEWLVGPRGKKPDPDGIWKSLLDALVACGRLVDDHTDWCELGPVTFAHAATKGILLTVEDL